MIVLVDRMALLSFLVGFLCFFSFLSLVNGTPQFTDCLSRGSSSVCLSQSVSYECSVNTTGGADTLRWRVFDRNNNPIAGAISFNKDQSIPAMLNIGTDFTANLTASSGPIVSDIIFTPLLSINNYTVECDARGTGSYTPVTCPILIAGIPAAPVPIDLNFTSDTLNFFWSASNSTCLSHYNVNVTSIDEYTINTDDTSLSLPVPSTNDTEYSISVVAVDTGGRYMDPSEITFTPDVPESVTNLTLNQTGLSIDVSWNEPPTLVFLPVLNYTLYYNVPDSDTSILTILAPTTTYNIPDATVGSIYTVGVAAVNVLGTGPNISTTISIISTSVSSTTGNTPMTTTMMTPSNSNNVPVTTMSEVTQSTSTTIPSPTSSTGGLNSTVYIGIGVGAAVIVIVILILIIVGCLIWRKPWKGEKAIFNQSKRDSTEPIALVDKKDHGSSPATGQPIYQEAMSSEDIQREAAPTTGELYAQPSKASIRRPPPQPQSELATYQDPSTIQRTQAPNTEYLYAEVDKKPQQQAVYAQVDKEKKGGDGTVYADLDLKNAHSGPVSGSNPANVIYSDVHNN